MVTVCPVEDPGCETDMIVTAGVGASEGCEDANVKGSASGVSILLICRGVGNGFTYVGAFVEEWDCDRESRGANEIDKRPTDLFGHHHAMAT